MSNNTNYTAYNISNDNSAAMALENYHAKLDKLHRKVGRPRTYKKMLSLNPMQSVRVIREITKSFMPKTSDINYFVGVI